MKQVDHMRHLIREEIGWMSGAAIASVPYMWRYPHARRFATSLVLLWRVCCPGRRRSGPKGSVESVWFRMSTDDGLRNSSAMIRS